MNKNDPELGRRACLRCHEWFDSEWPGNRICKKCSKKNAKLSSGLPVFDIDNSGYPLPPDPAEDLPRFEERGTSSSMQSKSSHAVES